ncbi:MAG: GtrA family protein [Paludibacter sp.]|nr:GtrA family protein [Paludibacter sp.]
MRKILKSSGSGIRRIVDFFYPPFRKYMSVDFFRYGATGAANLVFDWVLYFCIFHFILHQQMLHLGFVTLSSHIAALALSFPISFMTGFLLQKYVTFTTSDLRGKVQLFRYAIVVLVNLSINYIGLKLLVDVFGWFPTPSKMVITILATGVSYISQKRYTFR